MSRTNTNRSAAQFGATAMINLTGRELHVITMRVSKFIISRTYGNKGN